MGTSANLIPYDSASAREAGIRSGIAKRERAAAKRAADAVLNQSIAEWAATYQRELLGPGCAAAAQKIAHMVLNGELTDQRALVAALPVLFDIARLEAGQHTNATVHATISTDESLSRLHALRAQALDAASLPLTRYDSGPAAQLTVAPGSERDE